MTISLSILNRVSRCQPAIKPARWPVFFRCPRRKERLAKVGDRARLNRICDAVNALHHNSGWFLFLFVATITFAIPSQADTARWDRAWRRQVDVRVEETAGLARANEPVELRLPTAGLPLERWRREMRVIELPVGKEVSSQVLAPPGKEQVAVAFSSTLEPKQKRAYRIYFDNPKAKAAVYQTDLTSQPVAGFVKIEPQRPFALSIRNK